VIGNRIFIIGGNDGAALFNDVHILNLDTMSWSTPETKGVPMSARAGHTAVLVDRDKIVIFGGGNSSGPTNDLYILNTDSMTWTKPKTYGT
jgi:N-acetylneuraminic acid mutarotase